MSKPKEIASILHFCSNELRFFDRAVNELRKFSSQIIVPFCDHFFNGEAEDLSLISSLAESYPDCEFVEFAFDVKQLYTPFVRYLPGEEQWLTCWHSTARYVGAWFAREKIPWLLFVDADEIIDGRRFQEWKEKELNPDSLAYWFSGYTYKLSASERKKELQQCALLVQREAICPHQVLQSQERFGLFHSVEGEKRGWVCGLDGTPLLHHYSWVRTEEEREKKMFTWAKRDQKNWGDWLEQLRLEPHEVVDPFFDPLSHCPSLGEGHGRWIKVDRKMMNQKELDRALL